MSAGGYIQVFGTGGGAIVGGAIVPVVLGAVADVPWIGLQKAFFVAAICYAYIAYYGASGYRPVKTVVPV